MIFKNLLLATALTIATGGALQAQNAKVIAHRGFWETAGSAQNSLKALVKADSIGCFASEFDVWLTADNQLVVNHDETFNGVKVQAQLAQDATSIILDNGENLPTLQQYLKCGKKLNTRLVLELKAHATPERETRAIVQIVKMVKKMGLEKRIDYITFSKHALKEFIRLTPQGTDVYYLEGALSPQKLKALGSAGPDYHYSVFRKNPQWIKESHDLGMKVNAWTVNEEADMKWLIEQRVDFITTNEPILLQQLLKK